MQLLRQRLPALLTDELVSLFAELTGIAFSVVWPAGGRPRVLPCQQTPWADGNSSPKDGTDRGCTCGRCFFANFDRAFARNEGCGPFVCPRGLRSYWLGLRVRGQRVAALVLLARAPRCRPARSACTARRRRGQRPGTNPTAWFLPRLDSRDFGRACRLLRMVAHDLSETLLATVEGEDLARTILKLRASETERARLSAELHRTVREASEPLPTTPQHVDRRRHSLRGVLEFLQANFTRPIQLRDAAAHLHLSETHVSHLVSEGLGIRFKQYLTDLRMERAEALLADPRLQVSEIALKVGFTDANRFRAAFREWAGLSPTAWRDARGPAQLTKEVGLDG